MVYDQCPDLIEVTPVVSFGGVPGNLIPDIVNFQSGGHNGFSLLIQHRIGFYFMGLSLLTTVPPIADQPYESVQRKKTSYDVQ